MDRPAQDFARIAAALPKVIEVAHHDRRAFRSRRIFATLAADGATANLLLTPHEQEILVAAHPAVFSAVPNAWGRRGWTQMRLDAADASLMASALRTAWSNGSA